MKLWSIQSITVPCYLPHACSAYIRRVKAHKAKPYAIFHKWLPISKFVSTFEIFITFWVILLTKPCSAHLLRIWFSSISPAPMHPVTLQDLIHRKNEVSRCRWALRLTLLLQMKAQNCNISSPYFYRSIVHISSHFRCNFHRLANYSRFIYNASGFCCSRAGNSQEKFPGNNLVSKHFAYCLLRK